METDNIKQPLLLKENRNCSQPPLLIAQVQRPDFEPDESNLRQLVILVRRRAWAIAGVAIAVNSAIGFWTWSQPSQYESEFKLLVEPITTSGNLDQLTPVSDGQNISSSRLDYDTQIQILRSPNLMSPIIKEINKYYPDVTYNSLIGKNQLTIGRLGETKIIQGRYRDTDPQKVKLVLHEVARGYLRYSFLERQTNLKQGLQFVKGQLPQLYDQVDKLQEQLQGFRQQNQILDPQDQTQELANRVSTLEQQQLEARSQLKEALSLYASLSRQLSLSPDQAIATATLSEAPRYQKLLNQLADVESKIAVESARFTADSPTIEVLRQEQQNLVPLVSSEAEKVLGTTLAEDSIFAVSPNSIRLNLTQQLMETITQIQVLRVRENALDRTKQLLDRQVQQMPVISRQYTDLQRELKVGTESLNRFLKVQETLEIETAQKTPPWQIILKPKQPESPISPNIERNIFLGAIASLLLGMGAAVLIERFDNVFHAPDELQEFTKLPLLGIIPYQKQLQALIPVPKLEKLLSPSNLKNEKTNHRYFQRYNASPFLEAFRSLHTNICFLGSDTPIHSIVISSATPAEGKSTTAVHLAQAATAMGQRVLLVDADLRRPQIHHILGLQNYLGLSDLIATRVKAKKAIQRLPQWDGLYVLTAGHPTPDPTRLLRSKKMQYWMRHLKRVFDLIIYDTPPMLGFADSCLLSAHTNGTIAVVGLGKTDRTDLIQALNNMKIVNTTVLGVIANGVKSYTTSSYYY
ncbi:MAG TPA: protein tyrosine kinase [Cyanobacteria bacterium UBA8803]|nr:protein tyrosine kinase [Cyanobacteria bacterium UBA9273]HBL62655.1 protein tyrosine kinase [Cyanobacteria bacterium UBA8803]